MLGAPADCRKGALFTFREEALQPFSQTKWCILGPPDVYRINLLFVSLKNDIRYGIHVLAAPDVRRRVCSCPTLICANKYIFCSLGCASAPV